MTLRKQSKLASAVESVVNTSVGLSIAYGATWFLFAVYGVKASHGQMFSITMWMTVISVIRSYLIRRAWNSEFWLRLKRKSLG